MLSVIASVVFLGNSASFLGTLVTLLVLCIFYERQMRRGTADGEKDGADKADQGNNFLYRILQNERERLRKRLDSLLKRLDETRSSIQENEDYLMVKRYADGEEGVDPSYRSLAVEISIDVATRCQDLQAGYVDMNGILNKADNSTQQFTAPFYSMIFGLMLFIADEILSVSDAVAPAVKWILGLIIIMSVFYWGLMWLSFILGPYDEGTSRLSCSKRMREIKEYSPFGMAFYEWVTAMVIFCLVLYFVRWPDYMPEVNLLVVCCICAAPFAVIGMIRLGHSTVRGRQSYMHVLGHLVAITIYAVSAYCALRFMFEDNLGLYFALPHGWSAATLVRVSGIAFVLVNGLVLPFLLPFIKYHLSFYSARCRIEHGETEAGEILKDFQKKYKKFCEAVTKAHAPSPKKDKE